MRIKTSFCLVWALCFLVRYILQRVKCINPNWAGRCLSTWAYIHVPTTHTKIERFPSPQKDPSCFLVNSLLMRENHFSTSWNSFACSWISYDGIIYCVCALLWVAFLFVCSKYVNKIVSQSKLSIVYSYTKCVGFFWRINKLIRVIRGI